MTNKTLIELLQKLPKNKQVYMKVDNEVILEDCIWTLASPGVPKEATLYFYDEKIFDRLYELQQAIIDDYDLQDDEDEKLQEIVNSCEKQDCILLHVGV
jgi:hypothetical protein